MIIYTGILKSYTIDELSEKSQQKAYENWSSDFYFFEKDELENTLDEFCRIFDISMYDWNYDEWSYRFDFAIDADNVSKLEGIRLARYIWNNYSGQITNGKYYSIQRNFTFKSRRSKTLVTMEDCPLTGVCYDFDILSPILDCLRYKTLYSSYHDLINDCLDKFFKACQAAYQDATSFERFIDNSQANEWAYTENGKGFYLPDEFEGVTA